MKKIVTLSALSLGILFLAGCGQQPVSQTQPTTPAPVPQKSLDNIKTFQSNRLIISFNYPSVWGDLIEVEGDFPEVNSSHPSRISIEASKIKNNPTILFADNGGDRMGRGGSTGDIVTYVNNQNYIKSFCQENKDEWNALKDDVRKCEYKTNSNNVSFVKYESELCSEGGCSGKGLFYLFYNPNSEYRGALLYTRDIQENKSIVNIEEEKIFDEMANSFKFTN